jgi:hypothetical protein
MTSNLLLAAIAALCLAACQSTLATLAPSRPESSVVFADRGAEVRAKHYRDVAEDCSNRGYANVAIALEPRSGRIELRREGAVPSFAADNPRFKCNQRRVEGVGVYYIPNPGFVGGDRFTIEVIWADGGRWTEDFTIQVR